MKARLPVTAVATLLLSVTGAVAAPAALAASSGPAKPARSSAQPWPVTITIQTVPRLPGIQFQLDGTVLTTGSSGQVSHTEQHNFSSHTLQLLSSRIRHGQQRYAFARWAGQRDPNQAFRPLVRGLPMRANYTVTASFSVWCPVKPIFTDQQGNPLDPAQISLVTLRSNNGRSAELRPAGTSWLQCAQPLIRGSTLGSKPLQYAVESVVTSGANVVHAGTQRFWPGSSPHPTIVGSFHNLSVSSHDALFGGGVGSEAVVTFPDRRVTALPLGPAHTVTLHHLPQGTYQVSVKAAGASVSAQTVRLSRNQAVSITAITRADLATIGGAVLALAAGLPFLSASRRRWLHGLLQRARREARSA